MLLTQPGDFIQGWVSRETQICGGGGRIDKHPQLQESVSIESSRWAGQNGPIGSFLDEICCSS
jgi:hypothetical protein